MRENLRNLRERRKLTQSELAKRLGVARTTYTNIELGTKNPSLDLAMKIKKTLRVKSDDIFLISNVPERNINSKEPKKQCS